MITIKYQLEAVEVSETLLCIDWKKECIKGVHCSFLGVLGIVIAVLLWKQPSNTYLLLGLLCITGTLFFIAYGFDLLRKRKAKKLVENKGFYQLNIDDSGIATGNEKQCFVPGKSQAFLSEHVISLKIEKVVYCIPRRILSKEQQEKMLEIVEKNCIVRRIKTEG